MKKAKQKKQPEQLNVEEALSRSEAFLIKYRNAVTTGVVAIVLVVAGIIMYNNFYLAPREVQAQDALAKGQLYFEQDAFEQALNGDSIGYDGFLRVIDDFSGTKTANLAKAYAGIAYAKLGKYAEAAKMLDEFDANDAMVAPAVLAAAGNCYAQLEQYDKATANLLKAADRSASEALSPIFLMQAGEIFVKQGKASEAVKAYTQIKEKYARSYQAQDIDKYIEQARLLQK